VNVEGITWHTIVLDPEPFAATKALMSETFGLAPEVEAEGMVLFIMPNGTMLELNEPQAASADYGFNDGLVFGVRLPTLPRSRRSGLQPQRAEVARAHEAAGKSIGRAHSRRGRHRYPTRCSVRPIRLYSTSEKS
jgi:hypothetical protein